MSTTKRISVLTQQIYDSDVDTYVDNAERIQVSSNDTTPGYISTKIVGGANVTVTEVGDGGNETLSIACAGGTDVNVAVDAAATAGYLGAANNDGVLRTGSNLSYTDGGNYVTLDVASTPTLTGTNFTGIPMSGVLAGTIPTGSALPNGAGGTTVDGAGEACVDTTSRTLNFYDGTAEVVLNPLLTATIFIPNPVAADDYPIITFKAAVTLVETTYAISGGTNWVGQVQEADDEQGTNAANTQTTDSTVTGNTTVTSFSNAGFDAGDEAYLKTTSVSGNVSWLKVQIWYRENA